MAVVGHSHFDGVDYKSTNCHGKYTSPLSLIIEMKCVNKIYQPSGTVGTGSEHHSLGACD